MAKYKKIRTNLDLRKNELINHILHITPSFPANARVGQFIFHSILQSICICINDSIDTTTPPAWKIFTSSSQSSDISGITCTSSEDVLDAVYLYGNNEVRVARANVVSTSNVMGFIVSKESSTSCTIRRSGTLSGFNGSGLEAGKQYFLSKNFDGGITDVPPTGLDEVLVKVGIGFSSDTLLIDIDRTIIIRR